MSPFSVLMMKACYNVPMNALRLTACIIFCLGIGVGSALVTQTGNSPWYQQLQKPSFNPPAWIFGPVWTLLYCLMGVCLFQLWQNWPGSRLAVVFFAVQLLLNVAWTPVFFGLHRPGAALVIIIAMLLAILATILTAWPASQIGRAHV